MLKNLPCLRYFEASLLPTTGLACVLRHISVHRDHFRYVAPKKNLKTCQWGYVSVVSFSCEISQWFLKGNPGQVRPCAALLNIASEWLYD